MLPEWDKLENFFKNTPDMNKNYNIAKINSNVIEELNYISNKIDGYPTIKFYNNGDEIEEFTKGREVNDF